MFSPARLFSIFTVGLAATSLVGAAEVDVRSPGSGAVEAAAFRRQESVDTQVLAILNTLKASLASPLGSIQNITSSGSAFNETAITPYFANITSALDTASTALAAIKPATTPASLFRRQEDPNGEIPTLVSGIINELANSLKGLLPFAGSLPLLGDLLAGVDTSLNQVLQGLSTLLQGVLRLVANLLSNVASLLRQLALGLSLGQLGF